MKSFSKNKINKFNEGQVLLGLVIFLLFITLLMVSALSFVSFNQSKIAHAFTSSKQGYFIAEAGVEDVVYRSIKGMNYDNQEVLEDSGYFATTTVVVLGDERIITTKGTVDNAVRKVELTLNTGVGVSFNYGVQIGDGGLNMVNNSFVDGNVFSNGPINGSNNNLIEGTVASAGPSGLIDGIYSTGTAYSHSIINSEIDEDVYYSDDLSGTIVWGDSFPNSPDQVAVDMPISEEMMDGWELDASVSVISMCNHDGDTYRIKEDTTLGFVKIECDLDTIGNPVITLNGPVWVEGDIGLKNSATFKIDSSLIGKSVVIIADYPLDRMDKGKVEIEDSATFDGNGTGGYVLLISRNNSVENGGDEEGVRVENNVEGDLIIYAPHGDIELKNNANLKEATGYMITLKNNAVVTYETGLESLLFDTGPGGGYSISKWEEI